MTMNSQQVQRFVLTYLEATGCSVIERSTNHVTVKLSPEADKALTNRPYYWGYVERTGVPAQTMSFTFIFDGEAYRTAQESSMDNTSPTKNTSLPPSQAQPGQGPQQAPVSGSLAQDQVMGRYFGHVPALPQLGPGRILQEELRYGSRRLHQIFEAARDGGKYVNLFEQPNARQLSARSPAVYEAWLGVCYKIEFACDLKREELYWLGISLKSGTIVPDFDSMLQSRQLSPLLAGNMHVQPAKLSVSEASTSLENYLNVQLSQQDYEWAEQARERLREELEVIDHYYDDLVKEQKEEEEKKEAIQEQHQARRKEMVWQYEPKVLVSAINCGIFHLR
ncbi:YqhG family protein [Paenibacillus sp. NPDC055715]